MNPYNFSLLFFAFCSFFVGILIWLKRQDKIGLNYFIFSVFVSLWGVLWSALLNQQISYSSALIYSRLSHATAAMISPLWFHLVVALTNPRKFPRYRLLVLYISAFIICLLSFSPWFIPQVGPAAGFKYYTKAGPLFHVFMFIYWSGVLFGFNELIHKIRRSFGQEKLQYLGFFFATLLGFIGGSLNQAPIYGFNFPQYNLFLMPAYPFIIAYFMIRHKLLDVEQIIETFQKEKLATIGLLAASVNHEIRNPLYAAKGVLEKLLGRQERRFKY